MWSTSQRFHSLLVLPASVLGTLPRVRTSHSLSLGAPCPAGKSWFTDPSSGAGPAGRRPLTVDRALGRPGQNKPLCTLPLFSHNKLPEAVAGHKQALPSRSVRPRSQAPPPPWPGAFGAPVPPSHVHGLSPRCPLLPGEPCQGAVGVCAPPFHSL